MNKKMMTLFFFGLIGLSINLVASNELREAKYLLSQAMQLDINDALAIKNVDNLLEGLNLMPPHLAKISADQVIAVQIRQDFLESLLPQVQSADADGLIKIMHQIRSKNSERKVIMQRAYHFEREVEKLVEPGFEKA